MDSSRSLIQVIVQGEFEVFVYSTHAALIVTKERFE